MRPGDFSPGNGICGAIRAGFAGIGFNEAGGFLPRKRGIGEIQFDGIR